MDPPHRALEQLMGSLPTDWRDVQGVIKTVFQALCDVAHAQSQAVRELERRTGEMQEELYDTLRRKADVSELRDARLQAEEEAYSALEGQRRSTSEVQALRNSVGELHAAMEKQRAEVHQWRSGFEAGLSQMVAESSSEVRRLAERLDHLQEALEEKANSSQLKEIVREAWNKEEGHLGRLQKLCESKVSIGDFASLAAVAEGKASLADVDATVQRQVQRRLQCLITDQRLVSHAEVAGITEAALKDVKERVKESERRMEDLSRKHQRLVSSTEEFHQELKTFESQNLSRPEVEALVAGALADWVRAAQAGAAAATGAVQKGRSFRDEISFGASLTDSFFASYDLGREASSSIPTATFPTTSRWASRKPGSPARVKQMSPAPRPKCRATSAGARHHSKH